MIVCQCNAVREREIRRAVRGGLTTLDGIVRNCRAGAGCGGCLPLIRRILADEAGRPSRGQITVAPAAAAGS